MCVIIIKQKGNVMSREIARTSSKINPHGLGIVWLDTFEVSYHKSKEYKLLLTERPFIAHFRYATVGKVGLSNTHPFICGNNKDELLMQNGTIKGIGTETMCDSKVLAISLGNVDRKNWKTELEQYDSRFVSINTRTRSFQIYNRNLYTYRDGIWYSKANVLQDNVVAVYGTLKKGYSNYAGHLKSAKYIGKGTTKTKYPLLIESLPFLVNKPGLGHRVEVDVFKVDDLTFQKLDRLEGHPQWYRREEIPVEVKGRTVICWVYFNPKELTADTKMYQSYTGSQMFGTTPYPKRYDTVSQSDFDMEENHQFIEVQEDTDPIFPSNTQPICIDCMSDVEFDGFANYHCSACGGWFKEEEVLKYRE